MLIRVKTVASDGTICSDDILDLDLFLANNKELAENREKEIRRTLKKHRTDDAVYRIDIMGGMYCDVSRATFADAKAHVRGLGFSLTRRAEYDEYRLAPLAGTPQQREAAASYTNDLADAIGTAQHEYRRQRFAALDLGSRAIH